MNSNVNEYFQAVSAYEMATRFRNVNRDEAASYLKLTRDLILSYIDGCNFTTRDDYLKVYSNVKKDAKLYLEREEQHRKQWSDDVKKELGL